MKNLDYIFKGNSKSSKHLTCYAIAGEDSFFAISISKKIGKANKRNRMRRRLTAILRENKPKKHLVIVVRADIAKTPFAELVEEIGKIT